MEEFEEDTSVGIVDQPVKVRDKDDKYSILSEANDRANVGYMYWKDVFDNMEEDVSYLHGQQYSDDELTVRDEENRLSMTFNRLPQFINRVTGAQRNNVKTINVSPTGATIGQAEPKIKTTDQKDEIELSDVLTGLIRDIEYQSNAKASYKSSFKQALEGGLSWLRVLTKYQPYGFDLDVDIKHIQNRWSVIVDPRCKETDFSDMNWAFISETMSLREFNVRYTGKSHEPLAGETQYEYTSYWGSEDVVTVTEYFRREAVKKKIVLMSNGQVYDLDDVEKVQAQLDEMGITIEKTREITTYKVIWCKISQSDILEEEIEFPTSTIPLIPVLGRVSNGRDKILLKGLITDAIDAQIAMNKMKSSALERIDMSPLSPWVATDKAIEGHEQMWAEANSTKFSTLIYKKGEERPVREAGATMPVAELQQANALDEDMKSSIGLFNASMGQQGNEVSGKAIEARQSEGDIGTFEFIDNLDNAIRRVGLLVTEIIPRVYDTERIIRIRGSDDSSQLIKINEVIPGEDGEEIVINDLNFGQHTVVISSGASYETKQQENATQIIDLMKVNPKVAEIGSDLLVRNLDFSQSDVLADRLEKAIPPQLLSKQKREEMQKDQPEPQPTPEQIEAQSKQKEQELDFKMKQMELMAKTEIEKIKLETARTNLQIKKAELRGKAEEGGRKIDQEESDRKEKVVTSIVDQMKEKNKAKEGTKS